MRYKARDITLGGLFGALGVALPILFHALGAGMVFLPMHLPILVCGLLVSAPVAFAVGFVTPLVSFALTGMPPTPINLLMTLELGTLAVAASLMHKHLRAHVIVAVLVAMVCARAVGGLERLALAPLMDLPQSAMAYITFSLITSWPGIAIQIVTAPAIVATINTISRKNAVSEA